MKLLIAGGSIWNVDEIFHEIIRLSGGGDCRIGVIPTANKSPYETWRRYGELFEKYGGKPILIDITEKNYKEKAYSKEIVGEISKVDGIFFTGGSQRRIVEALIDEDGGETPALKAVRECYSQGKLIAGSSAGAAIMSNPMIYEGMDGEVKIGRGLGFLMNGKIIIDQHFIQRGRLTRLVEAMWRTGIKLGIGIDEETALVVEDRLGRIIGKSSVIILESIDDGNFKLSYLSRGDEVDLERLKVKVSGRKKPLREEMERKRHYIVDLSTPKGIYTALRTLPRIIDEYVEAYVLRVKEERGEERFGYAYKFRFERGEGTEFYIGEEGFERYQKLTALNVYMNIERKTLKILFSSLSRTCARRLGVEPSLLGNVQSL